MNVAFVGALASPAVNVSWKTILTERQSAAASI